MDKLQQVRNFLEKTVKEKGVSLNALSLQIGKNSTYLFHFIKRHSPKRLDENTRRKLAKILDVSEQDLCDFPLPSTLIQDKLDTISSLFNLGKNKTESLLSFDVIDMDAAGRGRFEQLKKNVIGLILMTPKTAAVYTQTKPEYIMILIASGEAMVPTINPGDMLWLDTSCSTPSADGIYLLNAGSDVLIRRLQINPFDKSIDVSSDNKAYRSWTIADYKKLDICGKIIFVSHRLT